jgi:inorganic triphosphatase YgiF
MSIARGSELELKLELTREELQRMSEHPALGTLGAGEPVTRTLRSIYFDTPDHRLRAQGISLRLRSDGAHWLQTVKAGTGVENGVSSPVEIEAMVMRPEPDLEVIDDRKVRRKVEKALDKSALEPVFETIVRRTTRALHPSDGEVELALDEGVVRARNGEDALCEAELELKSGNPACLLAAAEKLFATQPIRLAKTSKAERGYSLALGKANGRAAPQRAEQPVLSADQTCGEALAVIVRSAADQIVANRRAVLETEDPAAAHQLRIGLRRLRSALRAFRPLCEDIPALGELDQHAGSLSRTVGELRDADVLIEEIHAPVVARILEGDPGVPRLEQALAAHRAAARERVRAALTGRPWSVLQLHLALWPRTIEAAEGLGGPVGKFARTTLRRRWKKVADSGSRLDDLTTEERHEMRKALKTLRYTAEFFTSLYPGPRAGRFVQQIRSLQEVFGYLTDVVAAERLTLIAREGCGDSPEAQRAAGFVLGWHNAQAANAWPDAHKGWRKLERLPQYWG